MSAEDGELGSELEGWEALVSRRWSRASLLRLSGGVLAASGLGNVLDAPAWATSLEQAASTELTLAIFQNPDSLDPAQTSLTAAGQVISAVFDPLIYAVQGHGKHVYHPGLATSYSVSRNATVYRFKLRRNVTFHDGTPFNAQAVKATFDHIVDPATKAKSELGSLGPTRRLGSSTSTRSTSSFRRRTPRSRTR